MNDRNVDQLLQAWLDLGPDVAPDRVHSAVALEVRTTRQAFGWCRWASERFPTMSNPVRIAAALAGAAVIAFVGLRYLVPDNTGNMEPTATPTPTASPTATPTATPIATPVAVQEMPGQGPLEPGRYSIQVPDSPVTAALTIGDGWTSGGWFIMNPPDFTKQVSFWTVANVNTDACDWGITLPDPPIGPTVHDLVSALDAQANTQMSAAVDVVVDGHAGKRITMKAAKVVDCPGIDSLVMWVDPNSEPGRGLEEHGLRDTLWILDVDGRRVVIDTSQDPSDANAKAEVADVIDSIQFEVN